MFPINGLRLADQSPLTPATAPEEIPPLQALVEKAQGGTPVERGEALQELDGSVGRAGSDALVAGWPEAQASDAQTRPAVLSGDDPVGRVIRVQDSRHAGRINLLEHEGRGSPPSHTIALHVGKSRDFLMNMMQPISTSYASAYRTRHSTFSSLESANALVSATLSGGREVSPGVFYREFSSPTGTAAVRRDVLPFVRPQGRVSIETAYGVYVVTRPDTGMPGGWRVQTAYPSIPFSGR